MYKTRPFHAKKVHEAMNMKNMKKQMLFSHHYNEPKGSSINIKQEALPLR